MPVLEMILADLIMYFWMKTGIFERKVRSSCTNLIVHFGLYLIVLAIQHNLSWVFLGLAFVLSFMHEFLIEELIFKNNWNPKFMPKSGSIRLLVKQIAYMFSTCMCIYGSNLYQVNWNQFTDYVNHLVLGKFRAYDVSLKLTISMLVLIFLTRAGSKFIEEMISDLKNISLDQKTVVSEENQSKPTHQFQSGSVIVETAATVAELNTETSAIEEHFRDHFVNLNPNTEIKEISKSVETKLKDSTNEQLEIVNKLTYTYNKYGADSNRFSPYIGMIERIIIALLVLNAAINGITFLVALKALSRYKQFEDKNFVQFFLLGTLLSALFGLLGGYILLGVWK